MRTAAACSLVGFGVATASNSDWEDFKVKFGKTYESDEHEAHRRGIFEGTLQFIAETNAKKLGYELGVNQFSDLLVEEFSSQYMGIAKRPDTPFQGKHLGTHVADPNEDLPDSVDWVKRGAVTDVKNQGQCGSCWSFSTTGALEGAAAISTRELKSFSEQQFVDCAASFGNNGCQGGLMDHAFQYAEQAAICTEGSYPYEGAVGTCRADSCTKGLRDGEVTGFKDVTDDNKRDLMSAVAQQPVSIAIEADHRIFQSYSGGVLSGMCGGQIDHGVLVVGYGTDPVGGEYWLVKNSWGATWGEKGYIKLKRGKDNAAGECGILKDPSYPVLAKETRKVNPEFEDFKKQFERVYESVEQEAHRRGIFEKNLEYIKETNAKNLGFELGVNQFADLLVEEWTQHYFGMAKPAAPYDGATYLGQHVRDVNETLPESVDWVEKGGVTTPKNQGQCGSCWSFSTTGSLEGANFITNGKLVTLSEQQFVDCAGGKFLNQGCNGGMMDNAFKFAEQAAICTEDSYSYKAAVGTCQEDSCKVGLSKGEVVGYKDVAHTEKDLMSAVAQQPVSIAIEADHPVFQLYKGGVLSGYCGGTLDHGVLVVGYGTDAKLGDYWKVKNSWGTTWGDEGYIKLKRGKHVTSGECGILKMPSYPQLKKAEATTIVV